MENIRNFWEKLFLISSFFKDDLFSKMILPTSGFCGSKNFDQRCSKKFSMHFLWSVKYYLHSEKFVSNSVDMVKNLSRPNNSCRTLQRTPIREWRLIAKGEKRKETKSKEFVAVAKLRSGKNKIILISILKQLVIRIKKDKKPDSDHIFRWVLSCCEVHYVSTARKFFNKA